MSKRNKALTFVNAPISITSNGTIVTLPKSISKGIPAHQRHLFCAVVDGVVQLSVHQPTIAIPVLNFDSEKFESR